MTSIPLSSISKSNIPVLLLHPDPPYSIAQANSLYLDWIQKNENDLLGKSLFEIITPYEGESRRALEDSLSIVVESMATQFFPQTTYRVQRNNGEEKEQVAFIHAPVLNDAGELVYISQSVIKINVEERGPSQDNVWKRSSNEQLKSVYNLFDNAPARIVVFSGPDLVFELINPTYQSFFPGRELLGKPLLEAIPELAGHPLVDGFKRAYHQGETFEGNEVMTQLYRGNNVEPDESYWNFVGLPRHSENGDIDGVYMFGFEVTELVQSRRQLEVILNEKLAAENELLNTEVRFNQVLEAMAEGVGIIDTEGNLIYANRMAQEILGLKRDEILDRTYHDAKWTNLRLDGSPLPEHEHPMYISLSTGKQVFDHEIAVQPPNGERFYISINAAPLKDLNGNITGGIGSFMDVTARRKSLQLKDEFISTVSHELKTPVTSIKAYAQVLQRLLTGDQNNTKNFLQRINVQINRLEQLIKDLLEIARLDHGKLALKQEEVHLDILLLEVVEELQLLNASHELKIEESESLWVLADRHRVIQVITNIVNNAVKYSPGAEKIEIRLREEQGLALCSVRDFGMGIAEEQKPYVFERFHQVASGGQNLGLGLGLYISKEIIQKSGGKLWFESEPDRGSTFYFTLPVSNRKM
ncbi:PAS domain-containing protein [Pedobacter sp. SYSU D00535]|uniref:PAS domain-containing protein n=1 Tax=Pedobacter sp. SYSU D00535 TaxID=2810308 RepID=UPI001A964831|nr:PAS domain-containing protein [Pedobacter sp. SYSU D00535]